MFLAGEDPTEGGYMQQSWNSWRNTKEGRPTDCGFGRTKKPSQSCVILEKVWCHPTHFNSRLWNVLAEILYSVRRVI